MKTIEQEIRERLQNEQITGENLEKCLAHIKADPLMRSMRNSWQSVPAGLYRRDYIDSTWIACWSSARDWIMAQLTAPVTKGEL